MGGTAQIASLHISIYMWGRFFYTLGHNEGGDNMKFLEKLRLQAEFSQILNENEVKEVKQNYLYRPYQSIAATI